MVNRTNMFFLVYEVGLYFGSYSRLIYVFIIFILFVFFVSFLLLRCLEYVKECVSLKTGDRILVVLGNAFV